MSNIRNIIASEMVKSNGAVRIMPGNNGEINIDLEWSKWLNYESSFETKKIETIYSKQVSDLTIDELSYLIRYKRNKEYAKLFEEYINGKISEENYTKVYNLMSKNSIDDLMISKLTLEEI